MGGAGRQLRVPAMHGRLLSHAPVPEPQTLRVRRRSSTRPLDPVPPGSRPIALGCPRTKQRARRPPADRRTRPQVSPSHPRPSPRSCGSTPGWCERRGRRPSIPDTTARRLRGCPVRHLLAHCHHDGGARCRLTAPSRQSVTTGRLSPRTLWGRADAPGRTGRPHCVPLLLGLVTSNRSKGEAPDF